MDLYWSVTDESPHNLILRNVSLKVPRGGFCVIIGSTGCGKSGLLASMVGDVSPSKGTMSVRGGVAYVAQVAWIQNMTLKDNILFGKPFDPDFYHKVVWACALEPDLDILPNGDLTEIGEKGINLSGGQKQRIALARAIYQRSDVCILDDCLSAVDAHVARHIFDNVFMGLLKDQGTTIVLVTHNLWMVPKADHIMLIGNEKTTDFVGNYPDLLASGHSVEHLQKGAAEDDVLLEEDAVAAPTQESAKLTPKLSAKLSFTKPSVDAAAVKMSLVPAKGAADSNDAKKGQLTQKETVEEGKVSREVYKLYIQLGGGFGAFAYVVVGLFVCAFARVGMDYWLSVWSDPDTSISSGFGLGMYSGLGVFNACVAVLAVLSASWFGVNAATETHKKLLSAIMRAPMLFFDTTPLGRILNRF